MLEVFFCLINEETLLAYSDDYHLHKPSNIYSRISIRRYIAKKWVNLEKVNVLSDVDFLFLYNHLELISAVT